MPHQTNSDLDGKAAQLIRGMTDGYNQTYGLGTMTCAVYDTAWVAMVSKIIDGQTQWLFPSSFRYLLDRQSPEGGWEPHASEVDGILNTLAALLALCKYENAPHQLAGEMPEDICLRISRATSFLRTYLRRCWCYTACRLRDFGPHSLGLAGKRGYDFRFRREGAPHGPKC